MRMIRRPSPRPRLSGRATSYPTAGLSFPRDRRWRGERGDGPPPTESCSFAAVRVGNPRIMFQSFTMEALCAGEPAAADQRKCKKICTFLTFAKSAHSSSNCPKGLSSIKRRRKSYRSPGNRFPAAPHIVRKRIGSSVIKTSAPNRRAWSISAAVLTVQTPNDLPWRRISAAAGRASNR